MSAIRQIYLLNPQEFNPETIAVTFAKTSRSPNSFREIAAELTDEKSAQFHEKWVVGYGHASVAEHAVLHIAFENISRLAVEMIESSRLASFTEKSTRYQKWQADAFFTPPELQEHRLLPVYLDTCRSLFTAYERIFEKVKRTMAVEIPRAEHESEASWERRIRSLGMDVCRFLLPAASLANVGMTANARILEHTLQKMLSSPLQEVREIGAEVKRVAQAEIPTLVKYADYLPYLVETSSAYEKIAERLPHTILGSDWCTLTSYDPQGEDIVLAMVLYRFGHADYDTCLGYVKSLSSVDHQALVDNLLNKLGEHDIPLRELEHTQYSFDITFDQGAYYEAKRHRMMTQTPQALTAELGYVVPRWIVMAGAESDYRESMQQAKQVYSQIAGWNEHIAAYVVPNGFNRRIFMSLNLREAYQFCSLRSSANAHFSIRRVALRMAEEIKLRHPALAKFMPITQDNTWQEIEQQYFVEI